MDPDTTCGKIHYYFREKYFGKAQAVIKEFLMRNPDDPVYILYNGLAFILSGRYQEGIREITPLQNHEDVGLSVLLSLIHAHKRCVTVDREVMLQLDTRLKEERRMASSAALYYGSIFLYFTGRLDKAHEFILKSLKNMEGNSTQATILKGWIEMYKNPNNLTQKVLDCFENRSHTNNLDASLGSLTFTYLQKDYSAALLLVDKLIPQYSNSEILLIEKIKMEFSLYNWDQVLEMADGILLNHLDDPQALSYKALVTVCKNGDYIEGADLLDKLFTSLEKMETKNAHLFYETALLFSRICGRDNNILTQSYRFAKHAAEMNPASKEYLTELGYQCLMQEKYKDAIHFFKSATKVDDSSIDALCGLTLCQMSESGPSEQIDQQIELLYELLGSQYKHPFLLLMSAKMEQKHPELAMKMLSEAFDVQINKSLSLPYGASYLKVFNPDFLLQINNEYLCYLPTKPTVAVDSFIWNQDEILPTSVVKSIYLLETVTKVCPGLVTAVYQLAKIQFVYGQTLQAQKNTQKIIENIDQTYANAHLLISQIYIQQKSYDRAEQSLEVCLSYNFKVRNNPMYHLLHGIIYKHKNKLKEALDCLTSAVNLLSPKHNKSGRPRAKEDSELNLPDKATLYLELIHVHTALGQHAEANKVMQDAIEEFSYTSEESRLTIVNAELALGKSDVDRAIELLSEIKPGQSYYLQAHTKLAHIYLKEKNDREMFASCFEEVVKSHPGSDGQTMLGDAYMSIHEPSHAVKAYEKAIEQNPQDTVLAKKMAVALVKMHLYNDAIQHYKHTIKLLNSSDLKQDLAELYMKLKRYDDADRLLSAELDILKKSQQTDYISMKFQSKVLMMLSKVKQRKGLFESGRREALESLKEAREHQTRLVKRAQLESHGNLEEEKNILSDICSSLAGLYSQGKTTDEAIQCYKEALQYTPQQPSILLALAKLYMQVNDADQCQQMCGVLLNTNPDNEAASVMMADLAFRKVDFETAAFHLKQLLTAQPAYWTALERLIDVQRRLGNLEDVMPFLTVAQEAGYAQEPGYLYCVGLYARYAGDPNAALRQWGRARRSAGAWGRAAALGVIRVCLAPGGEPLPPPLGEEGDMADDVDYRDTRSFALGMADRLLAELQQSPVSDGGAEAGEALELRLLGARLALAGRRKAAAEGALKELLQLAGQEGLADHVGVAVTLAMAYIVLKQTSRARNQLKRVSRTPWTPELADWLESCWLLLADCLLGGGGGGSITSAAPAAAATEAAREALQRALRHNQACAMALEYFGFLCEKEQSYKQAAVHYENAWKYGGHGNASVGYKYAYSLLKAKKYAESIAVCREVLIAHPDCPKIRKEVMEKARNHVRL